MWSFESSDYKSVVQSKRAERARLLNSVPKLSSSKQQAILSAQVLALVEGIKNGEWTTTEVMEAYIAQAVVAHAMTNCATEVLFDQALAVARTFDEEFASKKRLRGPLHGVPFSLKDQFLVKGYDTTIGFTRWAHQPATSDAAIVEQLISLGAIPIIKTNVPQTMFSFECNNPLWGRTTNPYNSKYTCGGSSGGEAALLALDGAAFGVGTDSGGSLRMPAACCGIYSMKPTSGRVSYYGARSPAPGFEGIKTVVGPLARSVEDLQTLCRFIFGSSSLSLKDRTIPLYYREPKAMDKLRIGYYTSDGLIRSSPANKRAVEEVVAALRKKGHECIEIEIPDVTEAMEIFLGLTSADGYEKMTSHLGPDPMDRSLWLPVYASRIPGFIRKLAVHVLKPLDPKFATLVGAIRKKSVRKYNDYIDRKNHWEAMFYKEVWDKYGLDGIIAPVTGLPQVPHGGAEDVGLLAIGTILYNVVDSPVGVLPVSHVDPFKDDLEETWTAQKYGTVIVDHELYKSKRPLYDPHAMSGMPIGIQVVGKKYEDEKVIGMMGILDQALGDERGFGPGTMSSQSRKFKDNV
ncbi:amidase signature domain-containing protein [Lentinula aciculospora]|uniref:amidase n=1 Tax=Lentinula aciculospora TaxID=153920 RepID=A0A9W9DJR2_9AGAR|nr:amidase signature domain-containing protein [Lentinula aciculospora]